MSLRRDAVLNLAGSLVPMLVAVPAVGYLARALEAETFSLVMLAWALVGYAGVLDMGLSRAVVRSVAQDATDEVGHVRILSTATIAVTVLGLVLVTIVLAGLVPAVDGWLRVDQARRDDAVTGVVLLALSLPALMPVAMLQGYWDGIEAFGEANLQRAIGGTVVPLLTVAGVALGAPSFTAAMAGLLVARWGVLALALTRGRMWEKLYPGRFSWPELRSLWSFGGWVMVSNLISPLMNFMDRYVLAHAQGAAVVGSYAAPCDAALKLLVVPVAVTRALFPKLVDPFRVDEHGVMVRESLRLIALVCVPLAVLLGLVAEPVLQLWLGQMLGAQAVEPLRILMIGFVCLSFAQVPFVILQAFGRADWIARVHLVEVVPFLAGAYGLSLAFGVTGAAWAWSLRGAVDLALLTWVSRQAWHSTHKE